MFKFFQLILWLYISTVGCTRKYFETFVIEPQQSSRNAISLEQFKWPNGIVHYIFDSSYNESDRNSVLTAMDLIVQKTCVKFVEKTPNQVEHIRFLKSQNGECGSNVGYRPNQVKPLDVTFSADCLGLRGAVQHELLHVLGLFHEQCRPDRDDYVEILWSHIDPLFRRNFEKGGYSILTTFDLPYDYESLMHYPGNAFAKRGENVTIRSKKDPAQRLGQSVGPTFYDLEKIRRMYHCK
ncbi:zinc metalloproteinase nas-4-like [Bradysia coprophila]|uniref:zinc metalloproteinase nas-4-like n=1 Tax=Bradysia coprophila TaxID=38358 RepID=UPI00187DC375|nr:zinc metalloproteinase nas-4-like [Bradysia coprophila]